MREDAGLRRLWDALPAARLVGGAVRDLLASRPLADLDLATPDPPETVQRVLAAAGIRTVPTGLAHGTVTAVVDGRPFEITTLRRDVATDGRHAETEWTADWRCDAARRDFTFNAMSLDRAGGLHDFFGGAADLRAGRVRFVGEAATRIREDHLRILRFFRFFARYGHGEPDPEALAAIREHAPLLARLSPERVWSELKRLLASEAPGAAVDLMAELGVLEVLLPADAEPDRLRAMLTMGAPHDPLLRLAALTYGQEAKPLVSGLRMSGDEARRFKGWLNLACPHPGDDDDEIRRHLAAEPADILRGCTFLAEAEQSLAEAHGRGTADHEGWARLREALARIPRRVFPLAGRDVVAAGVPPGRAVGEALEKIRAWWLAGGAVASRDACLARLADPSAFPPTPRG